jgi:serine/threonine-protein kinase
MKPVRKCEIGVYDEDLLAGQVFAADFRIIELLAEGGMGTVYVAEQISTGKRRALKLMLPGASAVDGVRRFRQEVRSSSRIQSEHVVDVIAAGIEPTTQIPWLAMELLDGESLDQLLERRLTLSRSEAIDILEQLVHALAAAHDIGIVHRDLKPDNVFLAYSRSVHSRYFVKVLDFGLAKLLHDDCNNTASMGSPLWMSPEQTQAGAPISAATDIWALGLLVFRMLSGHCYWRSDPSAIHTLMNEILNEPFAGASHRSKELDGKALPAGFDAWFGKCVVRDPDARFQHAQEAWEALVPLLSRR